MSKPKLFFTRSPLKLRNVSQKYLDSLRNRFDVIVPDEDLSKQELCSLVEGSHAIVAYPNDLLDGKLVEAAGDNLKVLSIPSAGYDNLKIEYLKKHGIRVGTAGSAIANTTAEMAFTLLLVASRRLFPACNKYKSDPQAYFRGPREIAPGLEDTVVGFVGAGRIGQSIARKVKEFAVRHLLYYNRSEKEEMKKLNAEMGSLEKVAQESDYLIVSLPLNEHTRNIISKRIISLMKPTAILVNIGRGGLIEQDALIEALQNKKIGGAALDVTTPEPLPDSNHPLLTLENVLISPHIGGLSVAIEKKVMNLALRNVCAALQDEEMPEELKL